MEELSGAKPIGRRTLLAGSAGTLALASLAACGSDPEASPDTGGPGGATSATGGSSSPPSESTAPSDAGGAGRELARLDDVPVGGSVSTEDADGNPVIVAQPRKGEVVAFSAVCTHRGCTVAPGDERLECPCHGSTFDMATGENTGGPAPKPLARVPVSVVDGAVVQG